jgi:lipopolysaccharide export system protein LptC
MGRPIDAMAEFDGMDEIPRAGARPSARDFVLTPPRDREVAFAAAGRRSQRIRILRRAILIGVVGAIAAVAVIWIFNPFASKFGDLSFSSLGIDGTKVSIARPKLSGFRSDGQPYVLTAERALQDVKQPTRIELQKLTGDIGMSGGERTKISADSGVYDNASEHMRLTDNIVIGNGRFDIRLRSADIDFKTGLYRSSEPIEVQMGSGTTIRADRAEARNNGQELAFDGHVRTMIIPQAEGDADAAKGSQQ